MATFNEHYEKFTTASKVGCCILYFIDHKLINLQWPFKPRPELPYLKKVHLSGLFRSINNPF